MIAEVLRARLCNVGKSAGNDFDALSASVPVPLDAGTENVAFVAFPSVGSVVVTAAPSGTVVETEVGARTAGGCTPIAGWFVEPQAVIANAKITALKTPGTDLFTRESFRE